MDLKEGGREGGREEKGGRKGGKGGKGGKEGEERGCLYLMTLFGPIYH